MLVFKELTFKILYSDPVYLRVLARNNAECIKEFIKEHNKQCDTPYSGANGCPKFSYIFTSFGLGTFVGIRCNICKNEKDITDIDIW